MAPPPSPELRVALELAGWDETHQADIAVPRLALRLDVVALAAVACQVDVVALWDELAADIATWPEFARSEHLPARHRDAFFGSDDANVAGWSAAHPHWGTEHLDEFFERWRGARPGSQEVRARPPTDPRLSAQARAALARDRSPALRVLAATNAAPDDAARLATDPVAEVRAAAARHPQLPQALLDALCGSTDAAVRTAARSNPASTPTHPAAPGELEYLTTVSTRFVTPAGSG